MTRREESEFVIGFLGATFIVFKAMMFRRARARRPLPPFTRSEFLALFSGDQTVH